MKIRILILLGLVALSACTPVRIAGGAAVGAGKVVVGAADVVF